MRYSLGIDAGGTYTDAVVIRDGDGEVVDLNKSLTTYPELLTGIRSCLDGIDPDILQKVSFASVSTTLATNSVLEDTGYPVGLILVNETEIHNRSGIENFISVKGGHDSSGNEVCPLDIESVKAFVNRLMDKVSAFAVSSYFSVRNPDHELTIKDLITELTGLPVVCGHELSQDLGAYERGVTAYLNARLIPVTRDFMDAVQGELHRRNPDMNIMMLKCDGSMVGIGEALKKPIESVFSGPAASLVGASFLSGSDTCAVIDVGGTSTDVSLMYEGLPKLSDSGAIVGGWHTKVRAIHMETSAMGGDSHVWVKNHVTNIGPKKVIPLCLAADIYPEIIEKVKKGQTIQRNQYGENIQLTKFFVRTGKAPSELSSAEKELLERIKDRPLAVTEIYWDRNHLPSPGALDTLIRKRLIKAIGFTPTDALHVLGDYDQWNSEASKTAASTLAALAGSDELEFCRQVKKRVARNMALNLVSFLLEKVDRNEIYKVLESESFARFRIDVPVVLLGGPVPAYLDELNRIIDAEIIVPENASVGNAVGAVAGKGVSRLEILIRSNFSESKYNLRAKSFIVFYPGGRKEFSDYHEALIFGERTGTELILGYMADSGLDENEVKIDISKKDILVHDVGIPVETKLVFLGIGETR